MNKCILLIFSIISQTLFAQLTPYTAQNGKMGYLDLVTNNAIIPAFYNNAKQFNGDYAVVKTQHNWQIIDEAGIVSHYNLQEVLNGYQENQFVLLNENDLATINNKGEVVSKVEFDELHYSALISGILVVVKKDKIGILRTNGEVLLPLEYEVEDFYSTFNWDGELYFSDSIYFPAIKNGKWGMVSMYGNELIPFEYEGIRPIGENIAAVEKNGKTGIVSTNGEILLPFDYDSYLGSPEGYMALLKNGKVELYDYNNFSRIKKIPVPKKDPWAEDLGYTEEMREMFAVSNKKKWGVINTKGKIIAPFVYDNVTFYPEKAVLTKNGKKFSLNTKGVITEQ